MKHTYSEFLKTKIQSKKSNISATFQEENGTVYIITPEFKMPFEMLYTEETHNYLLIAAQQLLDIKLSEIEAEKEVKKIVKNFQNEEKQGKDVDL